MDTGTRMCGSFVRSSALAPSLLLAAVSGSLIIGAGCSPRGPARHHIEGSVTFDGEPVPSGLIRFEPDATKGNSGPVGYAAIIDGRYTTGEQGSKGALQGPLVAVMTGGPAKDPQVEFPKMWFEDYHTSIDLDPKAGTATFDFDVPNPKKRKNGPLTTSGRADR